MSNPRWYLVQCKPRQCERALEHLERQGLRCFLPRHRVKRQRRQTLREFVEPLFPHYLFVCLHDDSNWGVIRSTRGVARLVRFNGGPQPVPELVIEGLRRHCARLNENEPEPLFKPGERVRITEGAFRELEAVVQASKGEERVVLLLNLLSQPQRLELPVGSVRPSDY